MANRKDSAPKSSQGRSLAEVCSVLDRIAPCRRAQDWDNVGLLAGDLDSAVRRVLLCIDLMPAVVHEALRLETDLVVAYHPPIFRPVSRLVAPSDAMESGVLRCIAGGVAVYAVHTALDAADGGANDVLARLCDLVDVGPLEQAVVDPPGVRIDLLVPPEALQAVADAMLDAGGGQRGERGGLSFRVPGVGTELGRAARGSKVELARKREYRLEIPCASNRLTAVLDAMTAAHPNPQPVFDIVTLAGEPTPGIGRVGRFKAPLTLGRLARKLNRRIASACVTIVGEADREIERAIVVVGAAGSLPFSADLGPGDVVVTGELRHHDALRIARLGASAIALSHWSSERPALDALASHLKSALRGVRVRLSRQDREPFARP